MKTTIIVSTVIIFILAISYFSLKSDSDFSDQLLFTEATKLTFVIEISATGELKAKRSVKIRGPQGMRSVGIWQTTINNLVPEGTRVKKGQFVASLDKTELATKMTDIQTDIEKEYTKLEQTTIDTAIQLKQVRDEMMNLKFAMAQEELEIEKNKYESQMVIDQSHLKLQNSARNLIQLETKIKLLKVQSNARVKEITTTIKQKQNKLDQLIKLSQEFTINAPEDGMVIYQRTWQGKKGPGSQISGFDPVVAELPDLSLMNSIAYVNEVDISKIIKGQLVSIKVDAFPDKSFTGRISSIANIGQQLKNQEAKVFEIIIEVIEKDEVLRPSMTTSNLIKIYEYIDVINVPLESYHSDSLKYVIVKNGDKLVKQEVIQGPSNANNIIIVEGVKAGDQLCISPILNLDELEFILLSDDIIQSALDKLADWKKAKMTYDEKNASEIKDEKFEAQDFSGSGSFIIMG